jgi:hypothetical protein
MVWEHLLTPTVKALLGPIVQIGEPTVLETTEGQFPGDEATNLNAHLLYGGQKGFVRYPYLSVMHRTAYGALVIKRDFRKLKVTAWVGEVDKGKAEAVFMVALRDRRFDGTKAANDTAMLTFPYDDRVNQPLAPGFNSLEVSIYSFAPGSRIQDATGDLQLDQFVEKPFTFLDRPQLFLTLFNRAWMSQRAPGQHAAPIRDTSKVLMPGLEIVAKHCGYDFLEAACSHYHVAMWFTANGYRFSYQHDAEAMTAIAAGLKRIRDEGTPLTRSQQSWTCVLQNLPSELVPARLKLGVKWPQDNITPTSLWVAKPLTKAAGQLSLPMPRPV